MTTLIYPNRFDRGRMIKAGGIVRIPGTGYNFSFRLHAPFGTEFIKVVASTTPFALNEDSLTTLGANAAYVISQGAATAAGSSLAEVAESLASYHIGPR